MPEVQVLLDDLSASWLLTVHKLPPCASAFQPECAMQQAGYALCSQVVGSSNAASINRGWHVDVREQTKRGKQGAAGNEHDRIKSQNQHGPTSWAGCSG